MKNTFLITLIVFLFVTTTSFSDDLSSVDWASITPDEIVSIINSNKEIVTEQNKDGKTALMNAAIDNPSVEVIIALIEAGSNINDRDKYGHTALMSAVGNINKSNEEVAKVLIAAGSDVNARDKFGRTVLMVAAEFSSNEKIIKALINAGSDVNARDITGWTTIMSASKNSNEKIIETLIDAGSAVKIRNKYGKTALMMAARINDNEEIIKILIKAGSDVNARDEDGKSAWDYIQENEELKNSDAYWLLNNMRFN